jgi:hypothetical protein
MPILPVMKWRREIETKIAGNSIATYKSQIEDQRQ